VEGLDKADEYRVTASMKQDWKGIFPGVSNDVVQEGAPTNSMRIRIKPFSLPPTSPNRNGCIPSNG
jgi:hypothetical protein